MKTIRILILEDDLKTLSVMTNELFNLGESLVGLFFIFDSALKML